MKKKTFIVQHLPEARNAGVRFALNPVVMLAQAALESGWGESELACRHHNLFGITGYGLRNEYWNGCRVSLRENGLSFRKYADTQSSFMDYARLISTSYPQAAAVSFYPEAFAREIAYSKYISEINGDNREAYRKALVEICHCIVITY